MTQQDLADALGVTTRAVKKWEKGGVPPKRVWEVGQALRIGDEQAPASVAAAALDVAVGGLVDEHGGRAVLGSLARVWRE